MCYSRQLSAPEHELVAKGCGSCVVSFLCICYLSVGHPALVAALGALGVLGELVPTTLLIHSLLLFVLYPVINPVVEKTMVVRVPLTATTLNVQFKRVLPDQQLSDFLDPIAEAILVQLENPTDNPLRCTMAAHVHAVKLTRAGKGPGSVHAIIETTSADQRKVRMEVVGG